MPPIPPHPRLIHTVGRGLHLWDSLSFVFLPPKQHVPLAFSLSVVCPPKGKGKGLILSLLICTWTVL